MKKNLMPILISIALIALSCNRTNTDRINSDDNRNTKKLKGTITISGAFALYPMTTKWAEEFRKVHPDVRIDISAGGAGKGMTDVLSGIVDLGMFSREISDVEKAKGVWWISVTKDAVLPTINSNSPVIDQILNRGISKEEFIKLFITREIKTWAELLGNNKYNSNINVYTRSDACGAAQMWGLFLDKDQESIIGIGIYGDPGMADAVKSDINGIGYNNIIYVYDINSRQKHPGLEIIPIDINENGQIDENEKFYDSLDEIMHAIKEGKYPSPPARELYFVARGKPERKEVIEFLKWIVTDGQAFVNEGGYVRLTGEKLTNEIKKLTTP